jgi:hypothetical protein
MKKQENSSPSSSSIVLESRFEEASNDEFENPNDDEEFEKELENVGRSLTNDDTAEKRRRLRRTKTLREDRATTENLLDRTGHVMPYICFEKLEQVVAQNPEIFDKFIAELLELAKAKNNDTTTKL